MKRLFTVLTVLMLVLSGCGGAGGESKTKNGDVSFNSERLVKEFMSTVNIFHRSLDYLLLSTEEEEKFKYYDIDISETSVSESQLTDMADKYIYYEPVGNKGFVVVEETDYKNTLKFLGRDNSEKVIQEDIGFADSINVSVSPKAGKIAYTSLLEGDDIYGLFIYDTESEANYKLMNLKSDGFIDGFHYFVNWSPDEHNVIINDKYIYDTYSGSKKGELKSAYSQWSPSGSKIAFVLEDGSEEWLNSTDYHFYPGKKICIYDISKGSYDEVFKANGDEYIFGGLTWGGKDRFLSFSGIKVADINLDDWYMKLNYSSVYILDLENNKLKKIETNVDASDGTMIELGNLKFTNQGGLLSFSVGNYEESSLHIVNTATLEAKTFENIEYLHWIDGENYSISAGQNIMYFCRDNAIIQVNESLQEVNKYKSKAKLDDFYLSGDGTGILVFELQDDMHIVRYIGE